MTDGFQIRLVRVVASERSSASDEGIATSEDLPAVMSEICQSLARAGVVHFEVSGFGQPKWPVDVSTDLAVVAEQLPEVLAGLGRSEGEVALDFYEQGIQRLLSFERAGVDDVRVTCRSGQLGWDPDPHEHVVKRRELVRMLCTLGDEFANVARIECPLAASHPAFRAWLTQLGLARALHLRLLS